MSGIKIIKGKNCNLCGSVINFNNFKGEDVIGQDIHPKTFGECCDCGETHAYNGHLETELLEGKSEVSGLCIMHGGPQQNSGRCCECRKDESEVKSEARGMSTTERPSKYHLVNVFSHKKYFDWYDLVDAKRASGVIIDPRIEHVEKKLFVNDRGHKGYLQDMIESRNQLDMAIEKEQERLKNEQ